MPTATRDDCELYYEVHGAGPPLVLGSGLGGTSGWWAPQVPVYAKEFTVLVFDQRGTGRSSRVPVDSVEQMAADLVAVLDAAGLDRVHYLGHSTGGTIGTAAALDHPSRIASLMIYASTTCGDAYRRRVLGLRRMLMERVGMDAYARYTTLLLYPPYWINAHAGALAAEEASAAGALGGAAVQGSRLDAILAFDRRSEYGRIGVPVRILCADDDILTPRYFSEEMARLIPGATAVYAPRGGHALSRVEPAFFDEVALGFFREAARA
jgi:aminoacrylate hydrolase